MPTRAKVRSWLGFAALALSLALGGLVIVTAMVPCLDCPACNPRTGRVHVYGCPTCDGSRKLTGFDRWKFERQN